jgi:hypothetical protein
MDKAPCLGIRTLVQQQHPTSAQLGRCLNLILDLTIDSLRRPQRVRHQVLDAVTRLAASTPRASAVPLLRHTQQLTQAVICIGGLISHLGSEAMSKTGPKVHQAISQTSNDLYRQSPAAWGRYRSPSISLAIHLSAPKLRQSIRSATRCSQSAIVILV